MIYCNIMKAVVLYNDVNISCLYYISYILSIEYFTLHYIIVYYSIYCIIITRLCYYIPYCIIL